MILNKSNYIAKYRDANVTEEDKNFFLNVIVPSIADGDYFKNLGSLSPQTRKYMQQTFNDVVSTDIWKRENGPLESYLSTAEVKQIFNEKFMDAKTLKKVISEYHPSLKAAIALTIQTACSKMRFKEDADLDLIRKIMLLTIEDYVMLPSSVIRQEAGETIYVGSPSKFYYQYGMLYGNSFSDLATSGQEFEK